MPSYTNRGLLIGLCSLLAAITLTISAQVVAPRLLMISEGGSLQRSQGWATYDPDPEHMWNQLYRQFYLRTAWDGREYGEDELDPLLWPETEHLLSGPAHQQALRVLDGFLSTDAERLITDPLKRAMLQRDLWAVFDWLCDTTYKHQVGRKDLERKFAEVIQRLALTPEEIRTLPDSYSAAVASKAFSTRGNPDLREVPFLPPDLFQPKGPWVCLGESGEVSGAPVHTRFFSGRSVFLAFLSLPAGRQATLAYLKQLRDFPKPMIPNFGNYTLIRNSRTNSSMGTSAPLVPNPELPQFPPGTQVALVRRMMLINNQGELTATGLTESVQIRVFRAIPSRADWVSERASATQDVFEFRLSRPKLFAGQSGGLRVVTRDDRDFGQFLSHPFDLLEMRSGPESSRATSTERFRQPTLDSCATCHEAPGIQSLVAPRAIFGPRGMDAPGLYDSSPAEQVTPTLHWKHQQYNWGLLEGLWK